MPSSPISPVTFNNLESSTINTFVRKIDAVILEERKTLDNVELDGDLVNIIIDIPSGLTMNIFDFVQQKYLSVGWSGVEWICDPVDSTDPADCKLVFTTTYSSS